MHYRFYHDIFLRQVKDTNVRLDTKIFSLYFSFFFLIDTERAADQNLHINDIFISRISHRNWLNVIYGVRYMITLDVMLK